MAPLFQRDSTRLAVLAAAIGVGGLLIFWYATDLGVGMANDSQDYVSTARSILAGRGVMVFDPSGEQDRSWVPLTIFPPLYPALLALSGWISGADVIPAARGLHALLLAINAMLALGLTHAATRSLTAATALGVLAVAMLLEIHAHGLSEAAFICFTLAGLWMTAEHLRATRVADQWILLVLGAISVGAALMTRYAGSAVVAACVIAIVVTGDNKLSRRFLHAAIFTAIAALPILLWTLHIGSITKSTGREILYHPPDLAKLRTGAQTIGAWFSPFRSPSRRLVIGGFALAAMPAFLLFTFVVESLRRKIWGNQVLGVLLIFTLLYLPFLLVSMTFFDALIALNARMLSPMVAPLFVVIIAALFRGFADAPRGVRCSVLACVLIFVGVRFGGTLTWARSARHGGLDYSTISWRNSTILKKSLELPSDAVIYTNAWDLLYLAGDRTSSAVPSVFRRKANQAVPRNRIQAQMDQMRQRIGASGFVVYFDAIDKTDFLATPEMINEWMPLECVFDSTDSSKSAGSGRIYRINNSLLSPPAPH